MNSAELLTRYGTGAEEAFEELVRRHADLVFSVAKRRLRSAALAEEATQVVFMRLANSKPRLSSEPALLGWLHRTTLHVSIDLVRSETRRRIREEKSMQDVISDEEPLWQEVAPVLDEALDRLKDEERAILLLRFFDKKAFAEVGAVFQISEDAAKMRVARALDKLRELLGAEKVSCTAAALGGLLFSRAVEAGPVGMVGKVLAGRALLPGVAGGLRVSNKAILVGTGSILLIGTLLFTSFWRAEEPQPAVAQVNPEAINTGQVEVIGNIPSAASRAVRRKFDPVTTRAVLRLLDSETGLPIGGGRLHMAYFYAGGVGERHTGVSDDEGQIAIPFPNKEGDRGANLFVTAKGYVPKVWSSRSTFPESYEMRLDPALTLAGEVVDEDGKPVLDVNVTMDCHAFEMDSRKDEHVAFNSPDVASITDRTGSFTLPFVPREIPSRQGDPGEVRLNLTADGFEVTQTNFPAPITARSDLKLVIRSGAVVMGRVVDPDGQPVANVPVRELHNSGQRILRTETDHNGNYWLRGVWCSSSERQARIVVQAEDWACQEKTIPLSDRTNVVDFVLAKSPVFRVAVRDEEGMPLADVTVRTDSDNQGLRKYEWLDRTNIDGRLEWRSAPAEPTLFWFEKVGYQTIRDMELIPDGTEYQIVLKRDGSTNYQNNGVEFRFAD